MPVARIARESTACAGRGALRREAPQPFDRGSRTAVVVIDMVNGCLLPEGIPRGEGTLGIVGNINRLLNLARAKGLPVVFIRYVDRAGPPDAVPGGEGGWGAQFVAELLPHEGDIIIAKQRYDAFAGTNLDPVLRGLGVRNLIFAGVFTSACVLTTVTHARYLNYRNCVVSDCTADSAREHHEHVLKLMEALLARVMTLEETAGAFGLKTS